MVSAFHPAGFPPFKGSVKDSSWWVLWRGRGEQASSRRQDRSTAPFAGSETKLGRDMDYITAQGWGSALEKGEAK